MLFSLLLRSGLLALALPLVLLGAGLQFQLNCRTTEAASPHTARERLERMQRSPQWKDGKFFNKLERHDKMSLSVMWSFFTGGDQADFREPAEPLPLLQRSADEFQSHPASGLRVTWLGHSTILLEIDGARILFDPVWGERASPFSFAGPKRFHKPPLSLEDLLTLKIDAVVISHNHYDHLDESTIRALKATDMAFVVPLGVGATFEEWGIASERITELDWWEGVDLVVRKTTNSARTRRSEGAEVNGVRLIATPARHFSGRAVTFTDQDQTLWASFAVVGPLHRVYFSGDTAMFPGFKEIGERFGPFDLTMLEVGAYNPAWTDVHLGPEQAVEAHQDLRGRTLLPIHWGTFDLALHSWTEPMERTLLAARKAEVSVLAPRPGESLEPRRAPRLVRWWPEVPFYTVADTPVYSTGLEPAEQVTHKDARENP